MPAKALRGQKLADELLRVAKIFEGKYRKAFLRSVISVVNDSNLIKLIKDIDAGNFTTGDSIDARLASISFNIKEMESLTSKAMVSSAKITNQVMNMEGSFNVVNEAFILASQNLGMNLSTTISTSAKQTLRGIIEELVSGSIPRIEALSRIALEVGLLPTHAVAVRNYRATLLGSGTPMPKVKTLTEAYTKRLLKYRADMIARTEVARSIGIGQTEFWKQMQAQGFLPPDANRVWITSIDEKTCEFCGPMNGLVASIGGGWQTSKGYLEYPQASHPHCRCTAGITMLKPKKSQAIFKLEELEWQNWLIDKGESAGHPFRGNQWTKGIGSKTKKYYHGSSEKLEVGSYILPPSETGKESRSHPDIDTLEFDNKNYVYLTSSKDEASNYGSDSNSKKHYVYEVEPISEKDLEIDPEVTMGLSPDDGSVRVRRGVKIIGREEVSSIGITKGESAGHPFRGNQWTRGVSGGGIKVLSATQSQTWSRYVDGEREPYRVLDSLKYEQHPDLSNVISQTAYLDVEETNKVNIALEVADGIEKIVPKNAKEMRVFFETVADDVDTILNRTFSDTLSYVTWGADKSQFIATVNFGTGKNAKETERIQITMPPTVMSNLMQEPAFLKLVAEQIKIEKGLYKQGKNGIFSSYANRDITVEDVIELAVITSGKHNRAKIRDFFPRTDSVVMETEKMITLVEASNDILENAVRAAVRKSSSSTSSLNMLTSAGFVLARDETLTGQNKTSPNYQFTTMEYIEWWNKFRHKRLRVVDMKTFDPKGLSPQDIRENCLLLAASTVQSWAQSSGSNPSIKLSVSAMTELGASGSFRSTSEKNIVKEFKQNTSIEGVILRKYYSAVAKEMYQNTQKLFAYNGITHVVVHRGTGKNTTQSGIDSENYKQSTVKTRPLSSWALGMNDAEAFSGNVVTQAIPVERVFSTPKTGVGCTQESEVVILGGKDKVVISEGMPPIWRRLSGHNFRESGKTIIYMGYGNYFNGESFLTQASLSLAGLPYDKNFISENKKYVDLHYNAPTNEQKAVMRTKAGYLNAVKAKAKAKTKAKTKDGDGDGIIFEGTDKEKNVGAILDVAWLENEKWS